MERVLRAKGLAEKITGYAASDLIGIEQDLASVEFDAGRVADAADRLARSATRCDALFGANYEPCFVSRGRLAQVLLRSGRDSEALALVPPLTGRTSDDSSPIRQGEAVVVVSKILARNGQLGPDHPMRVRLIEVAEAGDDSLFRAGSRIGSLLVLAEADLLQGKVDAGRARIAQAASRISRLSYADPEVVGWQLRLEGLALEMAGQDADALSVLRRAHDEYLREWGTGHPLVALYDLNQCQALARTGRKQAAMGMIDAAIPVLQASMGTKAPQVERVLRLRAQIEGGGSVAQDLPAAYLL